MDGLQEWDGGLPGGLPWAPVPGTALASPLGKKMCSTDDPCQVDQPSPVAWHPSGSMAGFPKLSKWFQKV